MGAHSNGTPNFWTFELLGLDGSNFGNESISKSKLNSTTKQNYKLNTQTYIKGIIINKNLWSKTEKKFQTPSNIEPFKLEVPRYRLRCHTLVELNGFGKLKLYGWVFFTKLSLVSLRKRTVSYGSKFLKNLIKEVLVLNNGFNIQRVSKLGSFPLPRTWKFMKFSSLD